MSILSMACANPVTAMNPEHQTNTRSTPFRRSQLGIPSAIISMIPKNSNSSSNAKFWAFASTGGNPRTSPAM